MAGRLLELERAYFVRKNTGNDNPDKPFNQIKRDYIDGFLGGIPKSVSMNEAERLWLIKVVADGGQTPNKEIADLWVQAVAVVGGTPSKFINDNKIKFYILAP